MGRRKARQELHLTKPTASLSSNLCRIQARLVFTLLFSDPETSIFIQECHPYTGNLNSETSGDSKNACLHCGDVLALSTCFMPATGGAVMQAAGQTHL